MADGRCVRVPARLAEVTAIDHESEVAPEKAGLKRADIQRIWAAAEALYRSGAHPAITLAIRKRGHLVLHRAIGALRGNAPGETGPILPLRPDAPVCLFSASKAITALLLHKQVEEGRLQLDDTVARYLPAFAAHGKGNVTIRQLLAHRAGIPTLPVRHPDPSLLRHWDALIDMLCIAPPSDPEFQSQSYHALTGGFIAGEIVRRVSGRELPEEPERVSTKPFGLRSLVYGLPPERRHLAPKSYGTGPRAIWPLSQYVHRIIGVTFERAASAANEDGFLSAVVPAGNMFANANDTSKLFQMLLNGGSLDGVQVFRPETVAEAIRPCGKTQFDTMLMLPMRFSAGFMLGGTPFGLFGPNSRSAFGHLGFSSVLAWADPSRELSVALLNTGKSVAPLAAMRWLQLVSTIAIAGR